MNVYKIDITKLPVDAIVNSANEQLSHGGGVAYAIAKTAGFELEYEGADYIRRHGPLKVTEVAVTTGGSLLCKKVLHAVGPRWSDYTDKAECQQHLVDTVYNCLLKADSLGFTSVAVPSISWGKHKETTNKQTNQKPAEVHACTHVTNTDIHAHTYINTPSVNAMRVQ